VLNKHKKKSGKSERFGADFLLFARFFFLPFISSLKKEKKKKKTTRALV